MKTRSTETQQSERVNSIFTRFVKVQIDDNLKVGTIFNFNHNKLNAKCNFESVKRLYEEMIQSGIYEYQISKRGNTMYKNPMMIQSLNEKANSNSLILDSKLGKNKDNKMNKS